VFTILKKIRLTITRPLGRTVARLCATTMLLSLYLLTARADLTQPKPESNHHIFGRVEKALVTDHDIRLSVRLDTGAKTSSLGATQIETYQKDGKTWVRFTVDPKRTDQAYRIERPVVRYIKIRKRTGEIGNHSNPTDDHKFERRPTVEIPVCLGTERKMVEVSLTDRSHFNYPMLLGRSGMEKFDILIDPSHIFTQKPKCPTLDKKESVS
jgi:hypothetical protein